MKRDLAVGASPELVPRPCELALDPLEVVELSVHNDVAPTVLARDRLIAGHQIDDAQPGVSQPHPSMRRNPLPPAIGATMVQSQGGAFERFRRDASGRVIDRDDATHGGFSESYAAWLDGAGAADTASETLALRFSPHQGQPGSDAASRHTGPPSRPATHQLSAKCGSRRTSSGPIRQFESVQC